MSDYHVLEGDKSGSSYKVAFHISTPTTTNKAGVTITTALIEDPEHTSASIVPHIGATETSGLSAGTIYEHVIGFKTHPDHDTVADRDRLDGMFTSFSTSVQSALQKKYAFWKFDRDVP